MKIQQLNKPDKNFKDFHIQNWKYANMEYYGADLRWSQEDVYLQVVEKGEIIGTLEAVIYPGVVKVKDLIVSFKHHRQGVGKSLMLKVEEVAKDNKAHKIYLDTGKKWPSVKFYQSLGYQISGEKKNHFYGVDFVELSKFI